MNHPETLSPILGHLRFYNITTLICRFIFYSFTGLQFYNLTFLQWIPSLSPNAAKCPGAPAPLYRPVLVSYGVLYKPLSHRKLKYLVFFFFNIQMWTKLLLHSSIHIQNIAWFDIQIQTADIDKAGIYCLVQYPEIGYCSLKIHIQTKFILLGFVFRRRQR